MKTGTGSQEQQILPSPPSPVPIMRNASYQSPGGSDAKGGRSPSKGDVQASGSSNSGTTRGALSKVDPQVDPTNSSSEYAHEDHV